MTIVVCVCFFVVLFLQALSRLVWTFSSIQHTKKRLYTPGGSQCVSNRSANIYCNSPSGHVVCQRNVILSVEPCLSCLVKDPLINHTPFSYHILSKFFRSWRDADSCIIQFYRTLDMYSIFRHPGHTLLLFLFSTVRLKPASKYNF